MKKIIFIFVSAFLLFGLAVPVHAMGEMSYWEGMDTTELIFMDSNSPIVVNKETITIDYYKIPRLGYDSKNELLEDENQITLTYELFNPTSETITTTLAYPLGDMSDSYNYVYQMGIPYAQFYQDNEKYEIFVNEKVVDQQLRYTAIKENGDYPTSFSEKDILDERIKHSFYYPELLVTVYSFEVKDVSETVCPVLLTQLALDSTQSQYFSTSQSGRVFEDYTHEVWLDRETTFDLYVFGKPLEEIPTWSIYHDGTQEEIEGTVILTNTKEMTFDDYVKQTQPTDFEISYIEWYNATVSELISQKKSFGLLQPTFHNRQLQHNLMRWYVFDVTLEPNETLTTTITAPVYPNIQETKEGYELCFNHLSSIASKEYKEVDVQINTNFKSKDEQLEKNEDGYQFSLTNNQDIQLTLINNHKPFDFSKIYYTVTMTFFSVVLYSVPILFIGLIVLFFWKNRLSNIKK